MEKLEKEEIIKMVDGCYYGQAMPFEVNQLIKEFIGQQDSEFREAIELLHRFVEHFTNNEMNKVAYLIENEYFVPINKDE